MAVLLLAGCAAPRLDAANERGGVVRFVGSNERQALAAADTHCRRYGMAAEITAPTDRPAQFIFRCT